LEKVAVRIRTAEAGDASDIIGVSAWGKGAYAIIGSAGNRIVRVSSSDSNEVSIAPVATPSPLLASAGLSAATTRSLFVLDRIHHRIGEYRYDRRKEIAFLGYQSMPERISGMCASGDTLWAIADAEGGALVRMDVGDHRMSSVPLVRERALSSVEQKALRTVAACDAREHFLLTVDQYVGEIRRFSFDGKSDWKSSLPHFSAIETTYGFRTVRRRVSPSGIDAIARVALLDGERAVVQVRRSQVAQSGAPAPLRSYVVSLRDGSVEEAGTGLPEFLFAGNGTAIVRDAERGSRSIYLVKYSFPSAGAQ
jgi:hypothetical protein